MPKSRGGGAEVEHTPGCVVGHIDGKSRPRPARVLRDAGAREVQSGRIPEPVAVGQSARDELREVLGEAGLAYGYLVVHRYLKSSIVASAFGEAEVRRMLDSVHLDKIPAGSPAVSGCLVREDGSAFWTRQVRPDLTCVWRLTGVPTRLDVLRSGDARNALPPDDALESALIAWGVVPPPRPSA